MVLHQTQCNERKCAILFARAFHSHRVLRRTRTCFAYVLESGPVLQPSEPVQRGRTFLYALSKPAIARFQRETKAESLLPGGIFGPLQTVGDVGCARF